MTSREAHRCVTTDDAPALPTTLDRNDVREARTLVFDESSSRPPSP
jgi:hypothetical protein